MRLAPEATSTRATPGAWSVLLLAVAAVLLAEGAAEPLALAGSAVLAAALLSWLVVRRQGSRLRAGIPAGLRTRAGERLRVPIELEQPAGLLAARDLLLRSPATKTPFQATGHAEEVQPGEATSCSLVTRFRERGEVRELSVELLTRYPLGLFETRSHYRLPVEILVLPRADRLRGIDELLRRGKEGARPRASRSRSEGDFFALREHRQGEGLRGVHWKLSARRGRLLKRELAAEDDAPLCIVLCTRTPRLARKGRTPSFEEAVRLAASLVETAALRHGRRVRLVLHGSTDGAPGPTATGRRHAMALLQDLAMVEAEQGDPMTALPMTSPLEDTVVVMAGSGSAPTISEGAPKLLDVNDPDLHLGRLRIAEREEPVPARGVYR